MVKRVFDCFVKIVQVSPVMESVEKARKEKLRIALPAVAGPGATLLALKATFNNDNVLELLSGIFEDACGFKETRIA